MTATDKDIENSHLAVSLLAAVPLRIMAIKERGGLNEGDIARARQIGQLIAEKGDILLFGGGKKGESAHLHSELAEGIAILSFAPGGVRVFDQHWCGNAPGLGGGCPGHNHTSCCTTQGGNNATLE